MVIKKIACIVCVLPLLFFSTGISQDVDQDISLIRTVADNILEKATFSFEGKENQQTYSSADEIPEEVEVKIKDPYGQWHYANGVIDMALNNLGDFLNEPKYNNFSKKHLEFAFSNYPYFENRFSEEDSYYSYPFGQLFTMEELDNCGAMGAVVIELYQENKNEQYREYIEKAADHITNEQERLSDGTLVRTFPHKMTIWGDDLYMSIPFLVRMGKLTGDWKYYEDALNQVLNYEKYLWDEKKELHHHAYYSDENRNGVAYWSRANGWMMMAKVHLLNYLPKEHPLWYKIVDSLRRQIIGIAKYQNANGLWHQLLDKSDSYEETSSTAMFVYSTARAVNQGWIDDRYSSLALDGWNGLKEHKITEEGDVNDICVGTSIVDSLPYYYNRPAKKNEKHGIGSVIDAGIEIIKLKRSQN